MCPCNIEQIGSTLISIIVSYRPTPEWLLWITQSKLSSSSAHIHTFVQMYTQAEGMHTRTDTDTSELHTTELIWVTAVG